MSIATSHHQAAHYPSVAVQDNTNANSNITIPYQDPSPTLSEASVSSSYLKQQHQLKHQSSFVRSQSRHFETFSNAAIDSNKNSPIFNNDLPLSSAHHSQLPNINNFNNQQPSSPWGPQKSPQWADFNNMHQQQPPQFQQHLPLSRQQSQKFSPQVLANSNASPASSNASPTPASSTTSADDDLIPTAIVIKNIPFAIKKEQLLDVLTSLDLPAPYAFNYHFDNGVFRGLAFANFASPEETNAVIATLNGREIGGRKLRVEYKKMLPLAERERIEREKRERRGQLEEQHRSSSNKMSRSHQPSQHLNMQNNASFQNNGAQPAQSSPGLSGSHLAFSANQPFSSPSPSPLGRSGQVDLNDPQTLEIYSKLLLFDKDPNRSELVFPHTLGPAQRRILVSLSSQFNLIINCQDMGEVYISKQPVQPGFDQNALFPQQQHALRGTRSFADIRGQTTYPPSQTGFSSASSSPFFPSQTPPPLQNNLPPLSLSLQQQRGYQHFNHQTNVPPKHQGSAFNEYSQYGGGTASLADSFSNLLMVGGGGSLSRVPSVNNLPGLGTPLGGRSPTVGIESIHNDGSTTKHSNISGNAGVIGSKFADDMNTNINDSNEATLNE